MSALSSISFFRTQTTYSAFIHDGTLGLFGLVDRQWEVFLIRIFDLVLFLCLRLALFLPIGSFRVRLTRPLYKNNRGQSCIAQGR
jgi:hypothetical protein